MFYTMFEFWIYGILKLFWDEVNLRSRGIIGWQCRADFQLILIHLDSGTSYTISSMCSAIWEGLGSCAIDHIRPWARTVTLCLKTIFHPRWEYEIHINTANQLGALVLWLLLLFVEMEKLSHACGPRALRAQTIHSVRKTFRRRVDPCGSVLWSAIAILVQKQVAHKTVYNTKSEILHRL